MSPLAIVFGSAGAMLMLIGLVGGGFTFSGSVMPRVGGLSRVLSFSVGGALVVVALALTALDLDVPSGGWSNPEVKVTDAPSADDSASDQRSRTVSSTDQQVIDLLSGRSSFEGFADSDLVEIAYMTCDLLDSGGRGRDAVNAFVAAGANTDDAIYGLAVVTTAYCPEYANVEAY